MAIELYQILNSKQLNNKRQVSRLLFFGIGNACRGDDGLGVGLIDNLEKMVLPSNIQLQSNYQLNIEDALEISEYDVVVFVDATKEVNAKAPFEIREVIPSDEIAFSTHAMSMQCIVGLADHLFGKMPKAFVLTMPGYSWEITDRMTEQALSNLEVTTLQIGDWLKSISDCPIASLTV